MQIFQPIVRFTVSVAGSVVELFKISALVKSLLVSVLLQQDALRGKIVQRWIVVLAEYALQLDSPDLLQASLSVLHPFLLFSLPLLD